MSPRKIDGCKSGTTAWVFAGQGAQACGMGRDIHDEFPQTRAIFANGAAGFDLAELCFEAPAQRLSDTRFTQAAMAAFAAAVIRVLQDNGLGCSAAMGLSLGEYCALHASGVLDLDALLALLGYRGAIMAEASTAPSKMTAVFGLPDAEVERLAQEAAEQTGMVVSCTNYNCPGQVVIGGDLQAVEAAEALLLANGAKRCVPLDTSGPFHTALMSGAALLLSERLSITALAPQRTPVVFNLTARTADDAEIPALLTRQLDSPVRFAQSILRLRESGVTNIIEIGPSKVLAGLIRKTAPEIEVTSIHSAEDLKGVIG
jgi:[acyl-carrier-protein] S-malonyltransferase